MDGKVVVITGSNSGIGKEVAVALAAMGATTVLACRNVDKAATAAAEVKSRAASDRVHVVPLDLADLSSVRTGAAEIERTWGRVDVLINNAGGLWTERRTTAQGFEQTFGVNHLGHFYLTNLLLDRLAASAPARVINVASAAHRLATRGLRWDDLQSVRHYSGIGAYNRSKLANILFNRGLAKRLDPNAVTANAAHPGPVRSGFGMDGDMTGLAGIGMRLVRPFEITPAAGADTVIFLAIDPAVQSITGGYWANRQPAKQSAAARDDGAADRLWAESERMLASVGFALAKAG